MMNIFVTGTDTDVGKTVVSSWICMHTTADYWKPIQTGQDFDQNVIRKISPHTRILPEGYRLRAPLSAYDAAKLEGVTIDLNSFERNLNHTVMEGAGGVFVPIAENFLMADLILKCNAAVLIVVKSKLGMINHVLMTVEVLQRRGIHVLGIVVNGAIEDSIRRTIETFSKVDILAVIPYGDHLAETLKQTPVPAKISDILL